VQQARASAEAASQPAPARAKKPFQAPEVKPPAPLNDPKYDPETMFNKLKGLAAFEEEVANTSLMSRFAAGINCDGNCVSADDSRRLFSEESSLCVYLLGRAPREFRSLCDYDDDERIIFEAI
jgi:hypothetical protein